MDQDTRLTLNTLLILLVALLQFLLHRGPQSSQVEDLEDRLADVEVRLTDIEAHSTR